MPSRKRLPQDARPMAAAGAPATRPALRLPTGLEALLENRLIPWRQALVVAAGALALLYVLNRAVTAVCVYPAHDCLPTWPVSIYAPAAPGLFQLAMVVVCLSAFALFALLLPRVRWSLGLVLVAAVSLCLASNLVQGVETGYVAPQTWGGVQYYNEAVWQLREITPLEFVALYEWMQPDGAGLRIHGSTHPPGAILSHWAIVQVVGKEPALVSVAVALLALPLLGFFFHGILRGQGFSPEDAGWMTFLLLLVPSVQVYGAATLDILVAAVMTGAVHFFLKEEDDVRILGTALCVLVAATLTFMVLFLVPVLLFAEWARRGSLRSCVLVAGLVAGGLLGLSLLGYDWINSFRIASAYENKGGFLLFADPVSYVFTRAEDYLDFLLFAGPFLVLLAWRGARRWSAQARAGEDGEWSGDLAALSLAALLGITALFATGAFRTGETARACLFLLPFLLFPVASYLRHAKPGAGERTFLLSLVFGQTVLMQASGSFVW